MGRKINVPKDAHVPMLSIGVCYLASKRDLADGVKGTDLEMRNYPGLCEQDPPKFLRAKNFSQLHQRQEEKKGGNKQSMGTIHLTCCTDGAGGQRHPRRGRSHPNDSR